MNRPDSNLLASEPVTSNLLASNLLDLGEVSEADHPWSLVLEQLAQLPSNWHRSGCLSEAVLQAIAHYTLECVGRPVHSLETGSGKSTVLFSHLSEHHLVFAWDRGDNSIKNVVEAPFFQPASVEFINGPTQKTLPNHEFQHGIQVALIDGPHGYPFPELEYYAIYPLLEPGALLIVDDIHIPTIQHLFQVIQADDMFELLDIVDNTAFLRRTDAPTFNPLGDGWWLQGYNRETYERISRGEKFERGQLWVEDKGRVDGGESVQSEPRGGEEPMVVAEPVLGRSLTKALKRSIPDAWKQPVPHSLRVILGRWL